MRTNSIGADWLNYLADQYGFLAKRRIRVKKPKPPARLTGDRVALLRNESADQQFDSGSDRMVDLAWQVVDQSSECFRDVVIKAVLLSEFVGAEKGDIADQLARSLCNDVLMLWDSLGDTEDGFALLSRARKDVRR